MKGKVYLFKMNNTDFYKIGMTETESINNRFQSFKMYCPNGGEIITVIDTDNARVLEKQLHSEFKDKMLNGEFFQLNDFDIQKILKYQNKVTNELISFFWENISNANITLNELKRAFNVLEYDKFESKKTINESIFYHLDTQWKDNKLTPTEIFEILKEKQIIDNSFSLKSLGNILRQKYTQKMKKIDGNTYRVYLI